MSSSKLLEVIDFINRPIYQSNFEFFELLLDALSANTCFTDRLSRANYGDDK